MTVLAALTVWIIDLPLSAVADTVTLPITIPATLYRVVACSPRADPDVLRVSVAL